MFNLYTVRTRNIMSYFKSKIGKTYYEYKKKGSKTPIIYLHGGPGGHCLNLSHVHTIDRNRSSLIFDQIGSGRSSEIPKKLWKIETFVKNLKELIDHLKIKEFHLAGGSWGTTLALEFYLKHQKNYHIKSLIFQSPMFSARDWENDAKKLIKSLPSKTKKIIKYCHEIDATDSKVYQNAVYEFYSRHVCRNQKKLKASLSNPQIKNSHGNEIYKYMWGDSEFRPTGTLKKYNRVNDLKNINIPTLFVCGEFDEATPETSIKYANKVKESSMAIIPNASHSIFSEKPQDLKKVIREFLREFE